MLQLLFSYSGYKEDYLIYAEVSFEHRRLTSPFFFSSTSLGNVLVYAKLE